MRVVWSTALLIAIVFAALNRERIFVRDPVASVYRDNVKQSDVEVYFNFSDEILLQQNSGDRAPKRTILQRWDMTPATPASLTCVRWLVCLTPADHAPTLPVDASSGKGYEPKAAFDGREITFTDAAGVRVRVKL
jgi:hypothetical protein